MDISEKILQLRKSNNLTQEQLAEKLGVSRQAISKWESAQSTPELDKLTALCDTFNVSTDYLLKPTKIDELSIKTDMLEKKQQELINMEIKRKIKVFRTLSSVSIYLLAFAVLIFLKINFWNFEIDFSPAIIILLLVIATALSLLVNLINERKNTLKS